MREVGNRDHAHFYPDDRYRHRVSGYTVYWRSAYVLNNISTREHGSGLVARTAGVAARRVPSPGLRVADQPRFLERRLAQTLEHWPHQDQAYTDPLMLLHRELNTAWRETCC